MDLSSGFTPITAWDRPRLAAYNVYQGSPEGVQRSLTNPESLSPTENWSGGDGPVGSLVRLATNPLVLIGAVLARKWPFQTAAELAGFGEKLTAAGKMLIPGLWRTWSHERIFSGTKFGKAFGDFLRTMGGYKDELSSVYSQGLLGFEKRMGRSINAVEDRAVGLSLDEGAHRVFRGQYREMLYREKYSDEAWRSAYKERIDKALEERASRAFTLSNPSILPKEVYTAGKETLGLGISKMLESPENIERIADKQARDLLKRTLREAKKSSKFDSTAYDNLLAQYDSGELAAKMKAGLKPIEGYLPHIDEKQPKQLQAAYERGLKQLQSDPRAVRRAKNMAQAEMSSDRYLMRRNAMLPSRADLEKLKPYLTPETFEAWDMLATRMAAKTGTVRQYSLRATPVLKSYVHDTSRAYTWTAKGLGPELMKAAEELDAADTQRIKTHLAKDVLIPIAKGKLTPQEADAQVAWSALKTHANDYFQRPEIVNMLGGKDSRLTKWIQKAVGSDSFRDLSWKNAGHKIANYMYGSALGGNPVSVAMNSLQTALSTTSIIEPQYVAKGFQETLKRVGRVASSMQKGLSLEAAFAKEIPEYAQMIGSGIEVEALNALKAAEMEGRLPGKLEKLQHALMVPFSMSERGNKLVAYFGGRAKALAEGLGEAEAAQVGQKVMELTQFPGGTMGTPVGLLNTWAPLRQFMQFPLRTLDLFTRDPGTAGRMLLSSGIALEAGRAAGLNLGGGLLWGALPTPQNPDSPFYPFPLVPPIVGMAGSVASDAFQGKWDQVPRELGLMVPGGVALERASTIMAPQLAQKLGRPYVDYENQQPDGSYPLYSAEGMLKGFKTPWGLVKDGLGWSNLAGDNEQEAVKWLIANRDRMRQAHREYVEALASNDMAKAQHINEAYKKAYPMLGDIVVKQQDLQAVHMRHDVSRLERIMETMPTEARQVFGQQLAVALGDSYETLLGVDPALLGQQKTAKARDASRAVPWGAKAENLKGFLEQENEKARGRFPGPRDNAMPNVLRQDQAGRRSGQPFGSFESFNSF